jgi:hypothetical protein
MVIGAFVLFIGIVGSGARETTTKTSPARVSSGEPELSEGMLAVVFYLVGTPEEAGAARAAIGRTSLELGPVGTDFVYTVLRAGTDQEEIRARDLIREAQFGYLEKPGVSVSVVDLRH